MTLVPDDFMLLATLPEGVVEEYVSNHTGSPEVQEELKDPVRRRQSVYCN